jgi:hypothetical protein
MKTILYKFITGSIAAIGIFLVSAFIWFGLSMQFNHIGLISGGIWIVAILLLLLTGLQTLPQDDTETLPIRVKKDQR